ncbi:MAG: hypothetical protein AAB466_05090 [Verrucomicrobiota bacterium]
MVWQKAQLPVAFEPRRMPGFAVLNLPQQAFSDLQQRRRQGMVGGCGVDVRPGDRQQHVDSKGGFDFPTTFQDDVG